MAGTILTPGEANTLAWRVTETRRIAGELAAMGYPSMSRELLGDADALANRQVHVRLRCIVHEENFTVPYRVAELVSGGRLQSAAVCGVCSMTATADVLRAKAAERGEAL